MKKNRILMVDDETEIRELVGRFLEQNGFIVTGVSSANEALALESSSAHDLIISDLLLEESDGLEMIAQLKSIRPHTPVLLLTSVLFEPEVVKNDLSKKVSAYLPKTTPLTEVLATIQRLLHH